jgi:hypothetical protein
MRRVWLALLLAGCTEEDPVPEKIDCDKVTDDDTFVVGLEKVGKNGLFDFKLMSAMPAPPMVGNNTWLVQISTVATAAPLDGASLVATPYMPAHGHGTGVNVGINAMADGNYELTPINFSMSAVWETTIRATVGDMTDSAMYRFCLP